MNSFQQHWNEIKSWHADNGRYTKKNFKDAVSFVDQTISFYEAGAHHKNKIAEAAIKKDTLQARPLILHSKIYWSAVITIIMWPFALLTASNNHNLWYAKEDEKYIWWNYLISQNLRI